VFPHPCLRLPRNDDTHRLPNQSIEIFDGSHLYNQSKIPIMTSMSEYAIEACPDPTGGLCLSRVFNPKDA